MVKRLFYYIIFNLLFPILAYPQSGEMHPEIYDTIPRDTLETGKYFKKIENIYDSIESKAEQRKWSRSLLHSVIVPENKRDSAKNDRNSEDQFDRYRGKTIRNIRLIRLNPFGTTLSDTGFYRQTWLNDVANTVHVKTRKKVIQRQLLISPGDLVKPLELADNERLIRDLPFIEDVRIIISEVEGNVDLVDVTIITKDVWSTAFYPVFKDFNAGKLEMWDNNILGTANEFQDNIHWDGNEPKKWGNEAFFKSRNIFGTFIDARLHYQDVFDRQSIGADLERKFFTPNTKYAGGFSLYKTSYPLNVWYYDTSATKEYLSFEGLDFWLGRAFQLHQENHRQNTRKNIVLASRTYWITYEERPKFEGNDLLEFSNRFLWLNYIAFSSQKFYKTNLIYNFGRTEDIPTGFLAKWTFGQEFGEFQNRIYTAVDASGSAFFPQIGYLYGSAAIGGFIAPEKKFQQGVLRTEINYFSHLHDAGRFKFRHFANLYYIRGINRFTTERINLNDPTGISGLYRNDINGKQKIVINLQSVSFSPYYLYGFRFSFFAFTDIAFLGQQNSSLKDFKGYTSLGFGIRFRNERLVFPTFQLRFSFYPNISGMEFNDYLRFLGEEKLNPKNFYPGPPAEIRYR